MVTASPAATAVPPPELAACPFCGRDDPCTVLKGRAAYVECRGCGVATSVAKSDVDAIAAWNRRHAPAAIERADGWRTIDSAPKDGTAVLVMRDIWPGTASGRAEKCNGHNTCVAEWWAGGESTEGRWVCYMDMVQDPDCPIEPTHWRPLPPPPNDRGITNGKD